MNKRKFYIYQEDLIRYEISKDLLTISKLVDDLNQRYCMEDMKKLRTDTIIKYLCIKGYLIIDENNKKKPTLKGNLLGIKEEYITDRLGEKYKVNLYNKRAQKYILDNLYEII